MRLKALQIAGYRGISHDHPLDLDDLGRVNVFIGPNNAGKSTALRFICAVASLWSAQQAPERGGSGKGKSTHKMEWVLDLPDESWWWQHERDRPILGQMTFEMSTREDLQLAERLRGRLAQNGEGAAGSLFRDQEWRVSVQLTRDAEAGKLRAAICPMVFLDERWQPLVRVSENSFLHLNAKGVAADYSDTASVYHAPGAELLRLWANSCVFFDAVRALDRSSGTRSRTDRSEDGAQLLTWLRALQDDSRRIGEYATFLQRVKVDFNALLATGPADVLEDLKVLPMKPRTATTAGAKGDSDAIAWELFAKFSRARAQIPLTATGTGTAQLLVMLMRLAQHNPSPRTLVLEEPENHLHPGLVRRLLRSVTSASDAQIFVSTHSAAILDGVGPEDRVFRFMQAADGSCRAETCSDLGRLHAALDDLGVSGSSLLQANSVLWVEGPSDRILLRYWLDLQARRGGHSRPPAEGLDYAFAFYGGRILSHFSLEQDDAPLQDADLDEPDRLALLFINRFSAVLMDRDRPRGDEQINETKARICAEAASDPRHRLAVVTTSREIENDVSPPQLLVDAIAEVLGDVVDQNRLRDLDLDGVEPFETQVIRHLFQDPACSDVVRARRKVERKVPLAHALVRLMQAHEEDVVVPAYVEQFMRFIESSRVLEAG